MIFTTLLGISCAHADSSIQSDAQASNIWNLKLTPSYYVTTHTKDAFDLNLRANYGPHAIWLGYYRRAAEFDQVRSGYEYTAQISFIQLVSSLQLATHDFVGGSVNAQIGDKLFTLLGFGRTNMQDYYNINFDPNDFILYGLGANLQPDSTLSLYTIKDDRLDTGQVVTHLYWHLIQDDRHRWSVDLSNKHGHATVYDEYVSGKALAVTYDYRGKFVRLAQDSKVNFTTEDQTRLSVGLRF